MNKLHAFNKWRLNVKETLEDKGYRVSFFDSPPCANNSMRIDFQSNKIEASIFAWEHGDIDFEAYNAEKEEFIFTEKLDNKIYSINEICNAYLEIIVGSLASKG